MNYMTKLEKKLNKIKKQVDKKIKEDDRKVVVCKVCGRLIEVGKEICVVDFDIITQNITYICENCYKKEKEEMKNKENYL